MLKLFKTSRSVAHIFKKTIASFASAGENLSDERVSYEKDSLNESEIEKNPLLQFQKWYHEARETAEIQEANAMILCTSTSKGVPSGRPVLLKSFDDLGFVFYTNYLSRKSEELKQNPHAALVFYWDTLEKVVRIEGEVEKISEEQSTEYFQSRPKESQIGAWSSPHQSKVVSGREEIELKAKEYSDKFRDVEKTPKPDFWGGWRVKPHYFEFWYIQKCKVENPDYMIVFVTKENLTRMIIGEYFDYLPNFE